MSFPHGLNFLFCRMGMAVLPGSWIVTGVEGMKVEILANQPHLAQSSRWGWCTVAASFCCGSHWNGNLGGKKDPRGQREWMPLLWQPSEVHPWRMMACDWRYASVSHTVYTPCQHTVLRQDAQVGVWASGRRRVCMWGWE